MKKIILSLLGGLAVVTGLAQQPTFILRGKISGADHPYLYMAYHDGEGAVRDSSRIAGDGSFEFSGKVGGPVLATVTRQFGNQMMDAPGFTQVFIEPGDMYLQLRAENFKDFKMTGSTTQDEASALEVRKSGIREQMGPIVDAFNKANEIYRAAIAAKKPEAELERLKQNAADIREQLSPFNAQINEIDMDFIAKHPNSYVSAYLLRFKTSGLSLAEAERLYRDLSPEIRTSTWGKEVAREIEKTRSGSPGSPAATFSGTDINGHVLSLEDYRGRYVLLDFWASWCVPCRKGNPHLLELHNKYKGQGFEIIGISDDDGNPEAWKKAVAEDQIGVWKHILRGLKRTERGFDRSADISEPYGIRTLPTKILIDPDGIIIGRYGGGGESDEAMDQKLKEIFGT